jgi:hypothetical protein
MVTGAAICRLWCMLSALACWLDVLLRRCDGVLHTMKVFTHMLHDVPVY